MANGLQNTNEMLFVVNILFLLTFGQAESFSKAIISAEKSQKN